jgi:hypothetical protein
MLGESFCKCYNIVMYTIYQILYTCHILYILYIGTSAHIHYI